LLAQQIAFSLAEGKQSLAPTKVKMPPGSPIGN